MQTRAIARLDTFTLFCCFKASRCDPAVPSGRTAPQNFFVNAVTTQFNDVLNPTASAHIITGNASAASLTDHSDKVPAALSERAMPPTARHTDPPSVVIAATCTPEKRLPRVLDSQAIDTRAVGAVGFPLSAVPCPKLRQND